ncbi:MAG: hypothetical protein JSR33_11210, partial [Proteobacteria bacterium]|nr:hypothetical protein [Pseudomonadota bacterium]
EIETKNIEILLKKLQDLNAKEIKLYEKEASLKLTKNLEKIQNSPILEAKNIYKQAVLLGLGHGVNLAALCILKIKNALDRTEKLFEMLESPIFGQENSHLCARALLMQDEILEQQHTLKMNKRTWLKNEEIRKFLSKGARASLKKAVKNKIYSLPKEELKISTEEKALNLAMIKILEEKNILKFYQFYNIYTVWKENFAQAKKLLIFNLQAFKSHIDRIELLQLGHLNSNETLTNLLRNLASIIEKIEYYKNNKSFQDHLYKEKKFQCELQKLQSTHIKQQEKMQQLLDFKEELPRCLWTRNAERFFKLIKIEINIERQAKVVESLTVESDNFIKMKETLSFRLNLLQSQGSRVEASAMNLSP